MIKFISSSPEETIGFAKKVGALLKGGDVIAFRGGLGAGKTTFTRGLALGMGLPDEVSSPTFALVNEYRGKNITLYHFDMYRIMNAEALETTGFYDYLTEDAAVVCEWSENIEGCLPKNIITITIKNAGCGSCAVCEMREITVEGDERFDNIGD